jgi:hydroxyethylthiazole kinase-like uncharacterized protein yjeF
MAGCEVLTVAEMAQTDRLAIEAGISSLTLMDNAGRAIADQVEAPAAAIVVMCGPGNNGGDGFAAARHLKERGHDVRVGLLGAPERLKGDAAEMARRWRGEVAPLGPKLLGGAALAIDTLFGAGLSRPLGGVARAMVAAIEDRGLPVVAGDIPSGIHGDLGRPLDEGKGASFRAQRTVTFFRKKPGHLLYPGRALCGEIIVADIGIPDQVLDIIRPRTFENDPDLWSGEFPLPSLSGHKYDRGHAIVVSGPLFSTGAARLAARGALRVGAGLVSVASPPDAVGINAAHLTAIMVKPFDGAKGLSALLADKRLNAVALGPGLGVGGRTQDFVAAALASEAAVVLDADALTSFSDNAQGLFAQLRAQCVLTPHRGEFERVFPGLLDRAPSKLEAAREAAKTAHCVVLLKGPDTLIAAPDGRIAINANAPSWLATAGAGDVLAGMIAGLLAQGMDAFKAACAGVWLHAEAASRFGLGLIAEDIPEQLPAALSALRRLMSE